jgi:hypothetical protein
MIVLVYQLARRSVGVAGLVFGGETQFGSSTHFTQKTDREDLTSN